MHGARSIPDASATAREAERLLGSSPAGGLLFEREQGESDWVCRFANSVARLQFGWSAADGHELRRTLERSVHRAQFVHACERALTASEDADRNGAVVEPLVLPLRVHHDGQSDRARGTGHGYELAARALDDSRVLVWIRMAAGGDPGTDELVGSASTLEFALTEANVGLWDWHVASGMTWRSQRYYELLGYGPREALPPRQETWEIRLHPDDHSAVQHLLHAHLFEGARFEVEYRLRTKNGQFKWFRDYGAAIRDEFGNPVRMVGTIVDIDALKRSEADLESARQAAEAASEAKSEFLANMSHEIRTPMTAIIGYAEMLDADDGELIDDEERAEHVAIIRRNGEHLLELINDILDLSKIEAKRLGIEAVEFSLRELLRDLLAMMEPRASDRDLELDLRFATAIPERIVSDPVRVRQILVNLVGNAVKFTHDGYVRLVAAYDKLPDEPPHLRIRVEDTGIGISQTQLARLFSPFSQADSSTTREYGGTGLGLTISQRLAHLLGGRIGVTSKMGVGSTFDLLLPLTVPVDAPFFQTVDQQSAPPATEDPAAAPSESGRAADSSTGGDPAVRGHVLLVEDGRDNQRLIRRMLESGSVTVEVVDNGLEAVRRLARSDAPAIDVVFMDMQMPVLDGYEATSRLREDGNTLPIVALTAHAMSGDRERCLAAGCTDYATKPIARRELLRLLEVHLPARK